MDSIYNPIASRLFLFLMDLGMAHKNYWIQNFSAYVHMYAYVIIRKGVYVRIARGAVYFVYLPFLNKNKIKKSV